MSTTLALDDELVVKAQAFTSLKEKSSLVREASKALVERLWTGDSRLGGAALELGLAHTPPKWALAWR
jgi:Arc/MetJ family transcription regulator